MLGYVSAVNFFSAFSSCNAYEVPIPRQARQEEVPVGPWQTGEEAEAAFCQVYFLELKFESTHRTDMTENANLTAGSVIYSSATQLASSLL